MAITNQTVSALSTFMFTDTANTSTVVAVKATSGTLFYLEADNTANVAVTYLRLWNAGTGSVTIGTTAPDFVFMLPASQLTRFVLPASIAFGTALSVACATTAGTAGTTGPSTAITVRITYT